MYKNFDTNERNILNICLALVISLIIFIFYFKRISLDNIIYFLIITLIFYIILNLLTKRVNLESFELMELFYGNGASNPNLTDEDNKLLKSLDNLFDNLNKGQGNTNTNTNTNTQDNKIISEEEYIGSVFKSSNAKINRRSIITGEEYRRDFNRSSIITGEEHHRSRIVTEEEYHRMRIVTEEEHPKSLFNRPHGIVTEEEYHKYHKYIPTEEEHKQIRNKIVVEEEEEEENKPNIAPYIMNNPTNVSETAPIASPAITKPEETNIKNKSVPLAINGQNGTPININISYNAQNSVNENNVGSKERSSGDMNEGNTNRKQANSNKSNSNLNNLCDTNNYYNDDQNTRVNYNNAWMYGKWAWNNKPDYYVPGNKNDVKYTIKQVPTSQKECPTCPLMDNTPWSNYMSGDDDIKK